MRNICAFEDRRHHRLGRHGVQASRWRRAAGLGAGILLLLLPAGSAPAEEGAAETAMRRHVDAFVLMMSAGTGFDEFNATHMSPRFRERSDGRGPFIFRVLAQRYQGKPARLESLEVDADTALFRLSNRQGEWAEYELMREPRDDQQRLGGFNARIIAAPLAAGLQGLGEREIIQEIDRLLTGAAREDRFAGIFILARHGKILYSRALGAAIREPLVPNRTETIFRLASVTKAFTGLAICALAADGKLSLDDTMGRYFPDLPPGPVRDRVTVRHLLTHTSGMESATLVGPHDEEPGPLPGTPRDQALAILARPLQAEPGSSYIYSNAGPVVLGAIIESVTGERYEDHITRTIFRAAGMSGATFRPDPARQPVAAGYVRGDGDAAWSPVGDLPAPGAAAGGAWASAPDLLAFSRALTAGDLIGSEMFDRMTTGRVAVTAGEKAAYGWMEQTLNGTRVIGHSGHLPGYSAQFFMLPENGYILVVLSNADGAARAPAEKTLQMLSTAVAPAAPDPAGEGSPESGP